MEFCMHCGAQLVSAATFCPGCGKPVERQTSGAPEQVQQPPQPYQSETYQSEPVQPQAQPYQPPVQQPVQPQAQPQPYAQPTYQQEPVQPYQPQPPQPYQQQAYPQQQTQFYPQEPGYAPQQSYGVQQNGPAAAVKKRKIPRFAKILIGFGAGGIAVALVVIFLILPMLMQSAANIDYYEVAGDKVPSIKLVLGEERKVRGTSSSVDTNGVNKKQYDYTASADIRGDLAAYTAYLREKDGFVFITPADLTAETGKGIQLVRNSVTAGNMVVVQIDYDRNGFSITVMRGKGDAGDYGGGSPSPSPPLSPSPAVTSPSPGGDNGDTPGPMSYTVQEESIPSIAAVLGESRDVADSSSGLINGVTTVTVKYSVPGSGQGLELNEYWLYLEANEGFLLLTDTDFATASGRGVQLGRNAARAGYAVIVEFEWDTSGYTIKTSYISGTVTANPTPDGNGGLPPLLLAMSDGVYTFAYTLVYQEMEIKMAISQKGDIYGTFMSYNIDETQYGIRTVIRDGYVYTIDMNEETILKSEASDDELGVLNNDYTGFAVLDEGERMFEGENMRYIEFGDSDGYSIGTYYISDGDVYAVELDDGMMYIEFYEDAATDELFEIPTGFAVTEY